MGARAPQAVNPEGAEYSRITKPSLRRLPADANQPDAPNLEHVAYGLNQAAHLIEAAPPTGQEPYGFRVPFPAGAHASEPLS